MKVPLSWLREFVAVDLPPETLAQRLTFGGLEVAAVHILGLTGAALPWDADKIVIGNVLEVLPHPNADKLVLATVDYGAPAPHTVVTGAPNLFPYSGRGPLTQPLKVVFAKTGARLYDGHAEGQVITTLKARPVRGVMSDAMLCSEKELGISEEHDGILFLEDAAPIGVPLCEFMGDVIFELEITPNYARALSMVGVAREVAALTGAQLTLPNPTVDATGPTLAGRAQVTIEAPELCPRFTLGLAEGVQIGPSPQWMQRRLTNAGMRPINNVVDISNYVMLEWGQPTHAFDYTKVADGHLIVRLARPGERLVTLDGKERDLTPGPVSGLERPPLLVCDATNPLAVAGVMGGASSEVSATTTTVLLEAAIWEPVQIRKTARGLKLPSEASRRFERGVDYELPLLALRRCLDLMRQYAGATIAQGWVDNYPRPWQPITLDLAPAEVTRIVGLHLSAPELAALLERLGFACTITPQRNAVASVVRVTVPSFRLDVSILADLCEEVARLYGYAQIPATRLADELPSAVQAPALALEQRAREVLVGCGLTELITHSLVDMALVATIAPSEAEAAQYVKLANPNTPEKTYMRRSLLPSLGAALTLNLRERERVTAFELGRVYLKVPGQVLPDEPRRLAIGLAGPRDAETWTAAHREPLDYYDLKGVIDLLVARFNLTERISYVPLTDDERFHLGRAAALLLEVSEPLEAVARPTEPGDASKPKVGRTRQFSRRIGVLGELHPSVRERLDVGTARVVAAELDLDALIEAAQAPSFQPLSRFPATVQDLSIVAPVAVPEARVAALIRRGAGDLLAALTLFDVYTGPQLGADKRGLTYHLTFRATDRTLTDEALAKVRKKIISGLERELGATIRG